MTAGRVVLAHGSGADEAALVVLPLVLLAVFLLLERRARRRERETGTADAGDEPSAQS